MASWGEFIAEIPIINKRSEGIFVKADHVLDLWEERNKLREELAKLRGGAPAAAAEVPPPAPVAPIIDEARLRETAQQERERCAREVEELAQSYAAEPEQRELVTQILQMAAYQLRHKDEEETADFLAHVEIPPHAEPATAEAVEEAAPMAELFEEEVPLAAPMDDTEAGR